MNMMPGIQPPFLRPSTPSQAMSLGGHQHQQHIAQTPPRQSPGAAVGRGSAPPMSAPSTPGPLGPAANISAAPMTPARSGSEIPQATSGISQTPINVLSVAPGSSAGVAPLQLVPPRKFKLVRRSYRCRLSHHSRAPCACQ